MSFLKTSAAFLASLSLIAASPLSAASCFTPKEWEAAHVRLLQLTLLDTTLQCENVPGHDYDAQYNAFMTRFHDQLLTEGVVFQAHFKRLFGRGAEYKQDKYITDLANFAQRESMNSNTFCADSVGMFQAALALEGPQLGDAALHQMNDGAIGDLCRAHVARAASKHPRHKRHHALEKTAAASAG